MIFKLKIYNIRKMVKILSMYPFPAGVPQVGIFSNTPKSSKKNFFGKKNFISCLFDTKSITYPKKKKI